MLTFIIYDVQMFSNFIDGLIKVCCGVGSIYGYLWLYYLLAMLAYFVIIIVKNSHTLVSPMDLKLKCGYLYNLIYLVRNILRLFILYIL